MKSILFKSFSCFLILCAVALNANALTIQDTEHAFLKKYSGQSKDFITQNLGKPNKVEIAVKPQNAEDVLKEQQVELSHSDKKEMIEMWYYDTKIQYAPNKSFSQAELTFVNNKCVNITLANKSKK